MKILMLNYEYPPLGGGGSNACKYVIEELSRQGVKVDLITSSETGTVQIEEPDEHTRIYKLPINKKAIHYWTQKEIVRYTWEARFFMNKLLKDNDYDLCHAFFTIPSGLVAYLKRKELPYIVSLRGSDVPGFNDRFGFEYIFLKPMIKKIWKEAEYVVANSQGLKELALETEPERHILVIRNGIDISEFTMADTVEHKTTGIICVSRLIKRKGIRYLIEALSLLKDRDISLTLVGEGIQEDELRELAKKLCVDHMIDFKGYVEHDNISRLYMENDIFVLPSLNEGMSNAVLEAMACGLPVIVTDTGGTSELIDGNGMVIPKKDPGALADALEKLIDEPETGRLMGYKSREIVSQMSWESVAGEYIRLYENISRNK